VRLPVVLAAAAFTGLVSAAYISTARQSSSLLPSASRMATCPSPFAAPARSKAAITSTLLPEMVSYTAFFGLHHMVLSALPLLAGTWYGCAVSGAGTGLVATMLADQMSRKLGLGAAQGEVRKGEVATENFVYVGAMSAMRMALRAQ